MKMSKEQKEQQETSRPKRKATNSHIIRFLQTRNPSRLENNDLKRALEASLVEYPDFWPEETASCSSSDATTFSSGRSSSNSNNVTTGRGRRRGSTTSTNKKPRGSSKQNHLNCSYNKCYYNYANSQTATNNSCPMSSVHNRYKPVAKKNIYNEADFFHDGIMQYIEYELNLNLHKSKSMSKKSK